LTSSIINSSDLGLLSESLYDLRDYCKSQKIDFSSILKEKLGEAKDVNIESLEIIEEIVPLGDEFSTRLGWIRARNILSTFLSEEENITIDEFGNSADCFQRISSILFANGTEVDQTGFEHRVETCLVLIQKIWDDSRLIMSLLISISSIESIETREALLLKYLNLIKTEEIDKTEISSILDKIETKSTRVKFLIEIGDSSSAALELEAETEVDIDQLDEKTLKIFADTISNVTNTDLMKTVVGYMDKGNYLYIIHSRMI